MMQALAENFRERCRSLESLMTVQEQQRRKRQRAASLANPEQSAPIRSPFEHVMPLPAWCKLKGFSLSTGKRLVRAGKVKVVRLSANRVGVTESADAAYMQACEVA
jgi:hypothetical protein